MFRGQFVYAVLIIMEIEVTEDKKSNQDYRESTDIGLSIES